MGFVPPHHSLATPSKFGIITQSPSQLSMAVLDDDRDWEQNKRQTEASSPDNGSNTPNQSSSNHNNPLGIPTGNSILPNTNPSTDPSSRQQPLSPQRISRIQREKETNSRFLHGDELIELRTYIQNLKAELIDARSKGDVSKLRDITTALHESTNMDAEHVYLTNLEQAQIASNAGNDEEAREYMEEAMAARNCLPQFNLSGLWVGKYGDHGYEMINVTYVEDTLVATKVTGDLNVPKGEITFTADLHPRPLPASTPGDDDLHTDDPNSRYLEPIELSDAASKQWGHKHLPRFHGQGQAAEEGYVNSQWMDGQLILVGEYFSFAWIPLGHQIFFGRPSAELTLKMLKQSKMAEYGATDSGSPSAVAEMRALAQRCFEETELMLGDEESEGELCFMTDDDDYFCQEGCFE